VTERREAYRCGRESARDGGHEDGVYGLAVLIVISGLPGTGKTTVGEAVARRSRAVWLSVDPATRGVARRTQPRRAWCSHS